MKLNNMSNNQNANILENIYEQLLEKCDHTNSGMDRDKVFFCNTCAKQARDMFNDQPEV